MKNKEKRKYVRHGGTKTPEYQAWLNMIQRCHNISHPSFLRYGGRGISVCARWLSSFENFLADVGNRPSTTHSIDRYPDNNGNYRPGNCRWATLKQQAQNKRSTRLTSIIAEKIRDDVSSGSLTQKEVAEKYGIDSARVCRIISGDLW